MAIRIGAHSVVVVVCFFWHFHFHYSHYLVISDHCFFDVVGNMCQSELQQCLMQQDKSDAAAVDTFKTHCWHC